MPKYFEKNKSPQIRPKCIQPSELEYGNNIIILRQGKFFLIRGIDETSVLILREGDEQKEYYWKRTKKYEEWRERKKK